MATEARHLAVLIERPADEVYAYVRDEGNLPRWAAGLAELMDHVVFAERNPFGVADHDVTMPDGQVVHNPMRVLPDGDGSELVFTVRRRPGMTDEQFEADAAAVRADLETVRDLLERGQAGSGGADRSGSVSANIVNPSR